MHKSLFLIKEIWYANLFKQKNQYFLQFSEKITSTQDNYGIKYVMQTDYDIIVESYFHHYFGLNGTEMS